jgi:glyoxylase-like metal-dependent hydrolase (beta-lactamase superfamily II)/rhodanese-related sulfurtransferase
LAIRIVVPKARKERGRNAEGRTMLFKEINGTACKTYLIASEAEAALVDPVLENVDTYLAEVARRDLDLRYIIDTHVHADHISGAPTLRDRTGADYVMHTLSASGCANVRVADGDTLRLGDIEIRVLHTPGHTQDSITLLLPDRILTGDFLFIGEGGAGRTDLPGGDAGEHWDALRKLADLPDSIGVWPAHDYHGRHSSTLGAERSTNPRFEARTRAEYVEWLNGFKLGPADWMADVVRANYACARDPRAAWIPVDQPTCEVGGTRGNVNVELVHTIPPDDAHRLLGAGDQVPLVLDVRQPAEFEEGHIPEARLLPLGNLPKTLDELEAYRDRPILTVCRSGGRSATAAAILTVAGFSDVRSLEGGMEAWKKLGFQTTDGRETTTSRK